MSRRKDSIMSATRKNLKRTIAALVLPIVVLTFACPSLADADKPSDRKIEREIEKELIEYCRENPEKAEAFFKMVNTSYPAETVFIYGPTCRIIIIAFKYGPRGWNAFKRVYKKMIIDGNSKIRNRIANK